MPGILFAAGTALLLAATGAAHPFHESIAEAEFNPAAGVLEVAMRVDAAHLDELLRKRAGGRPPSQEEAARAGLLAEYLIEKFQVNRGPRRLAQRWIGEEEDGQYLWMFFELLDYPARPGEPDTLRVRHAVMQEHVTRQINSITFISGAERRTLRFHPGVDEWLELDALAAPPASAPDVRLDPRTERIIWLTLAISLAGAAWIVARTP